MLCRAYHVTHLGDRDSELVDDAALLDFASEVTVPVPRYVPHSVMITVMAGVAD